jgi:hypothetical protein
MPRRNHGKDLRIVVPRPLDGLYGWVDPRRSDAPADSPLGGERNARRAVRLPAAPVDPPTAPA